MAGAPDLPGLLAAAREAVEATNWSAWQPPPGDVWVAEHLFADQPPLTGGTFTGYLSFCTWLWQRPISPAEQERVRAALVQLWTEDGLDLEYTRIYNIMSLLWLLTSLQGLRPEEQEELRQQLVAELPDGSFPGVDTEVPGAQQAEAEKQAGVEAFLDQFPAPSPDVALDGLFQSTTFGLQLDITGPPGSGTWGTQTELYAFFPNGRYMYFPSPQEAGAELSDPQGHEEYRGSYEISTGRITLHDATNGQSNTSDYSVNPDRTAITFYGKTFTRIADTSGLTP
jgi:hypothetical protein